jgi:serine protease Do
MAAMLSAGPVVANAAPAKDAPWGDVESFEWSSSGPRLGVMIMNLTDELRTHFGAPEDRGVLVAHVEPGSAAAKAGIQVGDVLVAVRGEPVREASDVISALSAMKKPDKVKIDVVRDKKAMTLDASITPRAEQRSERNVRPPNGWLRGMFPWLDELSNHDTT